MLPTKKKWSKSDDGKLLVVIEKVMESHGITNVLEVKKYRELAAAWLVTVTAIDVAVHSWHSIGH